MTATARGVLALIVATTAVVALWWPTTAGAQGTTCTGYAPTAMTISPSRITPGGTVTAAGVALKNAPVTLTLRKPDQSTVVLATGTAQASGAFSILATIPADLPAGDYELIGTSPACPAPFTVVVSVTPQGGSTTTSTTAASTSTSTTVAGSSSGVPSSTSVLASVQDAGSGVLDATETRAVASGAPAADAGSSSGPLAFTGGEVRPLIVAAIAIIALGALLVGSSRRRDRA